MYGWIGPCMRSMRAFASPAITWLDAPLPKLGTLGPATFDLKSFFWRSNAARSVIGKIGGVKLAHAWPFQPFLRKSLASAVGTLTPPPTPMWNMRGRVWDSPAYCADAEDATSASAPRAARAGRTIFMV